MKNTKDIVQIISVHVNRLLMSWAQIFQELFV